MSKGLKRKIFSFFVVLVFSCFVFSVSAAVLTVDGGQYTISCSASYYPSGSTTKTNLYFNNRVYGVVNANEYGLGKWVWVHPDNNSVYQLNTNSMYRSELIWSLYFPNGLTIYAGESFTIKSQVLIGGYAFSSSDTTNSIPYLSSSTGAPIVQASSYSYGQPSNSMKEHVIRDVEKDYTFYTLEFTVSADSTDLRYDFLNIPIRLAAGTSSFIPSMFTTYFSDLYILNSATAEGDYLLAQQNLIINQGFKEVRYDITSSIDGLEDSIDSSIDDLENSIDSSIQEANDEMLNYVSPDQPSLNNGSDTQNVIDDYGSAEEAVNNVTPEFDNTVFETDIYTTYNSALSFYRSKFEDFVDSLTLSPLIVYCLTFGLALFVIGRGIHGRKG